jgi:serine phosphatase RsbU (regulator of sigma subunit)
MLGVIDDPTLNDAEVVLAPNDALVLFTDGLLGKDDRNRDERDALAAVLAGASDGDVLARIRERVAAVAQERQDDDVAVLVLRATGLLS